jgi:ribonuclease HII
VAGVDEAGRGPLAGPVVAAAFVFSEAVAELCLHEDLSRLTDSKKLTERQREAFFKMLTTGAGFAYGVGIASVEEIDRFNILQATYMAMRRALNALDTPPAHILVDGRPVPGLPAPSTAIVGGDGLSLSIAAASVIAKVTRDHLMMALDMKHPEYGFASHKGYGTARHVQALLEHGPLPQHRRSFRPVREADMIRQRQQHPDAPLDPSQLNLGFDKE